MEDGILDDQRLQHIHVVTQEENGDVGNMVPVYQIDHAAGVTLPNSERNGVTDVQPSSAPNSVVTAWDGNRRVLHALPPQRFRQIVSSQVAESERLCITGKMA
jgi:hypothetical protein